VEEVGGGAFSVNLAPSRSVDLLVMSVPSVCGMGRRWWGGYGGRRWGCIQCHPSTKSVSRPLGNVRFQCVGCKGRGGVDGVGMEVGGRRWGGRRWGGCIQCHPRTKSVA